MSNTDTILTMIRESSGLTDAELVRLTGIQPHQQVNQICNRLARSGRIRRERDARGTLVNRPVASVPVSSQLVATVEAPPPSSQPFGPGMRPARTSDLEALEPATTLLVIACSGSKTHGGTTGSSTASGPSVLESLPADTATRLRAARANVRERVVIDERTLMPALNRYSGAFYQAGGAELARALDRGLHVLIISGGYGVLAARAHRLVRCRVQSFVVAGECRRGLSISLRRQ